MRNSRSSSPVAPGAYAKRKSFSSPTSSARYSERSRPPMSEKISVDLEDAEALAQILGAHPDYRILRRFIPDPVHYLKATPDDAAAEGLKLGIFADVEATGLNTRVDKIIQLTMVPFFYNGAGEIVDVGKGIDYYEDPLVPLSDEIKELTGI